MKLHVRLTPNWLLDDEMREYPLNETVDACIVGTGAAGGVMAQRLARYGFSVVALEAGDWADSEKDMVSDEQASRNLYWMDPRVTGGSWPLALGDNNSGKTVGGTTVTYSAFCPRLHPSDFMVHTLDGVAVDWPIRYEDLEPYYQQMEDEYPVAGPAYFPWGKPHGYAYKPLESSTHGHKLIEGCLKLGIPVVAGGPVGITSGAFGKRPHCIFRGQCHLGCKVGAKHSTLVSHIPDAIKHGAEVRAGCMAFEIPTDGAGRATGVRYYRDDGDGTFHEEFQPARLVIAAGYAIETPRLLLNSKSGRFPNGLANSSGLVGKNLMTQAAHIAIGRYSEMIRQYKGPPAQVETEEFYETDPSRGFARGYSIQSVGPLPISMANILIGGKGLFGMELREAMADFNHYACWGLLGELLPDERNYVSLSTEKDHYGLPVAYVHYNLFENDKKLIEHAKRKVVEIHEAAGAEDVFVQDDSAHLIGTCRMGFTPQDSVVDRWCRSWDVPNLFIPDGSCLPTQGAANPALTISALAARSADYIRDAANRREL